jgi:hypothetical protein
MINRTTSKLDHYSIIENLNLMSYWDGDKPEYFYLYEENFIYIETLIGDLETALYDPPYKMLNAISKLGHPYEAWNTVIATLEDTPYGTLAEIDPEIEETIVDDCGTERIQQKYREKLERLTKKELLDVMLWVSSTLMKYLEVKAAYDTMTSVLEELEQNNSMLNKNGCLIPPEAAGVL